jgi:hypothetical protein
MRYVEFRDAIRSELRRFPAGLTWADLKKRLKLPYAAPCPEWVKQMEQEIGLSRERGSGRALVWRVSSKKSGNVATPAGKVAPRKLAGRDT